MLPPESFFKSYESNPEGAIFLTVRTSCRDLAAFCDKTNMRMRGTDRARLISRSTRRGQNNGYQANTGCSCAAIRGSGWFDGCWHDSSLNIGRFEHMPVNVVRTPDEEIAWERAKARAREEYPDATGERFYRIVMAIYKKMAHYEPQTTRHRRTLR